MTVKRRDAALDVARMHTDAAQGVRSERGNGSGLAPILRVSVFDEVVERLVQFIVEEGLKPGDRLPPERMLSQRLGVGRSTIREAVMALRAVGVVEPSQRGLTVGRGTTTVLTRPLSWGLLINVRSGREIMAARVVIETGLAGMAASRATDEDLLGLEEALESMALATSPPEFATSDLGFHLAVARAGHNFVLYHVVETLQHVIREWIEGVAAAHVDRSEWIREHRIIFEAIRDGRDEAARAAMETHLSAASHRLLDILRATGSDEQG